MRKILDYLKCKITGHYNKIRTGKCGLHLYYDGCGCNDCNIHQQVESDNMGVYFNMENNKDKRMENK